MTTSPSLDRGPREETIEGTRGARLFVRSWRPATTPRATVVICHGFKSHSGFYSWTASRLVDAGFAVYAADLRGRGKSSGERYYVEDVSEYVDDVATTVNLAKSREPGLPLYLLGHSAGGVISCYYTLDRQSELAGLICESFAFRVPAPPFALSAIKGLSRVAPRLPVLKLKARDFSRDPAEVKALNDDPSVNNEVQPAITVAALVRATERLEREFSRITIPVFIMHGSVDNATLPAGSRFFNENAGSMDKTFKLYEGHFHDLLADYGREQVMSDITSWIEARLPRT